MKTRVLGLAMVVGCLALAGCSASDAGDDAIWPSNATQLVVLDSGGFTAGTPAGSACATGSGYKYTLTVADRKLAWNGCKNLPSGNVVDTGARTLSDSEYAELASALGMLVRSDKTGCGADKDEQELQVTTPSGTHDYFDSFYACENKGTYVDNTEDVLQVLRALITAQ